MEFPQETTINMSSAANVQIQPESVSQIRTKLLTKLEWSVLTPAMHGYNYRQSWTFGTACAARVGASSEHIGFFQNGICLAAADVRVRKIPILGGGIAYISGGPLLQSGPREIMEQNLSKCLETLIEEYVSNQGLVLRIAPPIEWAAEQREVQPVFNQLRFKSPDGLRRYRTILIPLTLSLEQLRKKLHPKWRSDLNRAEKNGLVIQSGGGVGMMDRFCVLHQELLDRKGFDVELSAEFYRDLQSRSDPEEKFQVKFVEFDGKAVAGHVGSVLGQSSVYLLGASTPAGNELKASYLMQWATLVEAKERGCTWYDLGGIDPVANPGVYRFKERMAGEDMTAHGPYELRPSGLRSRLTHWAEHAYRSLRRQL